MSLSHVRRLPARAPNLTRLLRRALARGWLRVHVQWLLWVGARFAALDALNRGLVRAPGSAWALATRSHVLQGMGRTAAALDDARTLLRLHPDRDPLDWFNLGFLCEQLGEAAEAAQAFEQVLARRPQMDRAWYGLGLARVRLGLTDPGGAAEQAFCRCAELQPFSPHPRYQLAHLLHRQGRAQEVAALLDQLQGFEPAVAQRLRQALAQVAIGKPPHAT